MKSVRKTAFMMLKHCAKQFEYFYFKDPDYDHFNEPVTDPKSPQGKGTLFVCLIPYEPVSYYKFKKSMHAMESMYKNKNLYRKKMESWRFLNKILAHKKFSWGSFRKFF